MGGWCKERHNKDENNKLEGLRQRPDRMEDTRWEGQNFPEVVAPQEEEEELTNLMYKIFLFTVSLFHALHVSSTCAHHHEVKIVYTASG